MGCDIHICVEIKTDRGDPNKWCCGDYFKMKVTDNTMEIVPIFELRSYCLFALLADVRNYDEITPISPQKGIPNDCCWNTQKELYDWSGDGHSYSWLTLREIKSHLFQKRSPAIAYDHLKIIYESLWKRASEFLYFSPRSLPDEVLDMVRIVFWFDN